MARDMSIGATGADVRTLQLALNFHLDDQLAPGLTVDGNFGQKTRAAVMRSQTIGGLVVDGIVGRQTTAALLNIGAVAASVGVEPGTLAGGVPGSSLSTITSSPELRSRIKIPVPQLMLNAVTAPPGTPPAPTPAPAPAPSPSSVKVQTVVVQAGNQFSVGPTAATPFVAASQVNILFKLGAFPAFVMSPGAQFSANSVGSPNGKYTGQGFIQIGPPNALVSFGPVDFINPFIQGFFADNLHKSRQGGAAIGNQFTWKISGDTVGLFVNLQAVVAWDMRDGKGAVSGQAFGGLQLDLVRLLQGKFH